MQSDSRSQEPRLVTLLALVGGIFGLTGVCVASYLAQDATREATPLRASATDCSGCDEGVLSPNGAPCGDLTNLGGPICDRPVGYGPAGRVPGGRVRVG